MFQSYLFLQNVSAIFVFQSYKYIYICQGASWKINVCIYLSGCIMENKCIYIFVRVHHGKVQNMSIFRKKLFYPNLCFGFSKTTVVFQFCFNFQNKNRFLSLALSLFLISKTIFSGSCTIVLVYTLLLD